MGVLAFFLLPNSYSSLAPDEGNYGALTEWIAQSKPANQYLYTGLYLVSRSLVLPASWLNRMGISGLDSVRIIASVYGLLILTLVAFVLLKFAEEQEEFSEDIRTHRKKIIFLILVFGFLPSHLIWSFLGLREAPLEFWVLVVFSLVFYLFETRARHSKIAFFAFTLAIPLIFSSRPQSGWALAITLLIYFMARIRVRTAQILIPLTLIGIITGYIATTAFTIETTKLFIARNIQSIPNPTPSPTTQAEFDASLLCKSVGQVVTSNAVKYLCSTVTETKTVEGLNNPSTVILEQADAIPSHHEANQVGAASVIKTTNCPNSGESKFDRYFCIAYRAPYTTFTFLFRPLPGADVTSSSSLLAAIENVFWLGLSIFIVVMLIRNRRLAFFSALAPSLLFLTIYSVAAGAYEGNMGTAFRHKSLILWVMILLLASTIVATQQRKAGTIRISSPSQE